MKLSDLANLVTVRCHLDTLCNNMNVVHKEDYRKLLNLGSELDKKFISECKKLDVDNLVGSNYIYLSDKDTLVEPKPIKSSKKKPGRKPKNTKKEEKADSKAIAKKEDKPKPAPKDIGHDDPEIAELLAKAKKDPKVKAAKD